MIICGFNNVEYLATKTMLEEIRSVIEFSLFMNGIMFLVVVVILFVLATLIKGQQKQGGCDK